jgi:hypothetical protein
VFVPEVLVGNISDFFSRPVVGHQWRTLKVGIRSRSKAIHDLEFSVDSIQIDGKPVQEANSGESVGIKVPDRVEEPSISGIRGKYQ